MQLLHTVIKSWKNDLSYFKKNIHNLVCHRFINDSNLDWKTIYLLVRIVTKYNKLRAFQFKLLKNVFYLNKMVFKFHKSGSPLCSFCNLKAKLHITCSKNAVIRVFYGTNSAIFYLTLLIFHRLLHIVLFLV